MTKKRGLGRGLSSLIPPGKPGEAREAGLLFIAIDAISPNPHQPRTSLNEDSLRELSNSILEHGLIQPLVVTRADQNNFTLIAGERRWRAARMAGLREVPVVVKEATPQSMLEIALIENIQRDDLNALEEALAYDQLINDFGLTQEEVAERVGKSRPAVANTVRLLNLPQKVQEAIADGRISAAHARRLLRLSEPEEQIALMRSIDKNGLSVRQVDVIVDKILAGEKPKSRQAKPVPPELADLETQFSQVLSTEVKIYQGSKKSRVVIYYYSDEELQSIYEAIIGEQ